MKIIQQQQSFHTVIFFKVQNIPYLAVQELFVTNNETFAYTFVVDMLLPKDSNFKSENVILW